jgi:hypothetical protein
VSASLAYGNQTVTFLIYSASGTPDNSGMSQGSETATDVDFCLHRPVPETAVRELKRQYRDVGIVVGTLSWRTTCPRTPVTLSVKASDRMVVDGLTYTIMGGALPNTDLAGVGQHVTIISERQQTGR